MTCTAIYSGSERDTEGMKACICGGCGGEEGGVKQKTMCYLPLKVLSYSSAISTTL
jgi:hypothetical protein